MARIHGQKGRLYVALASGGTAEPVAFLNAWSASFNTDKVEVTAFGDGTKVYVAGIPDAQGDFSGWYDDGTVQTYTAATDGQSRKFYLYPNTNNNAQYWFGTGLFDFKVEGGIADAVKVSGTW